MKDNRKTIQVLLILTVIFSVIGGSLAYWNWSSQENQNTNVVFTIEKDFSCSADGGGNISHSDIKLAPTDCTDTSRTIKRKVTVSPVLDRDNLTVSLDLWLNIHELGEGLKNSPNFRYVLTTSSNSCEEGTIISEGNFRGRETGDKIRLITNDLHTVTPLAPEEYYLYIWLDKEETNSNTMNQKFNLSLGGVCDEVETLVGDAYALYTEEDSTLTFVRSETEITVYDNYKGRSIDEVYTGFEENAIAPWKMVDYISTIIFEDTIRPISTAGWFAGWGDTPCSFDLTKLDTSQVKDMSDMFSGTGSYSGCELSIAGLENFDTSNVTNMSGMFQDTGTNSDSDYMLSLDFSNWDVSNVKDMSYMFSTFRENREGEIIGLENWDVSKVENMDEMLSYTYYSMDLSDWNVSNVINYSGFSGDEFDPVWKNVQFIVYSASDKSLRLYSSIGDASLPTIGSVYKGTIVTDVYNISANISMNWPNSWYPKDAESIVAMDNIVAPTSMGDWFGGASKVSYIDLSKLDTSDVRYMYSTFKNVGSDASVTNMTIIGIENFDTSNLFSARDLFYNFGLNADYILDLSGWDASGIRSSWDHSNFDYGVEDKIIEPTWNY